MYVLIFSSFISCISTNNGIKKMDRKAKGAMNTTTTTDPMDAMTTIGIRQATDE